MLTMTVMVMATVRGRIKYLQQMQSVKLVWLIHRMIKLTIRLKTMATMKSSRLLVLNREQRAKQKPTDLGPM